MAESIAPIPALLQEHVLCVDPGAAKGLYPEPALRVRLPMSLRADNVPHAAHEPAHDPPPESAPVTWQSRQLPKLPR